MIKQITLDGGSARVPDTQYSVQFLQGMVTRMVHGYHKYGSAEKSTTKWLETVYRRLDQYSMDGNTEWLMDAANFIMCEFMYPRHPNAHFRATESNESPGLVEADGSIRTTPRTSRPTFHRHEGD